jgi:quercetin dioxygenase-like cupin family protein
MKINKFVFDAQIEWQDAGGGIKRKILAFEDKLMMVKVSFETGGIGLPHHHFHCQMAYVESGVFEVDIEGKKKVLKAGDVYHIPSNEVHGVVCIEAGILIDVFSPMREDFL